MYDKLSLDSFKTALKAGKYKDATGARRAVGKASTLTDQDKNDARGVIDKHFGSSKAATPMKMAASKPAKATKATVKTTTAKKEKAEKPVKATPAPKAKAPAAKPKGKGGRKAALLSASSEYTDIEMAERTINSVSQGVQALNTIQALNNGVDVSEDLQDAATTIAGAIGIFKRIVNQDAKTHIATDKPLANGLKSAEQLFNESQPQALVCLRRSPEKPHCLPPGSGVSFCLLVAENPDVTVAFDGHDPDDATVL